MPMEATILSFFTDVKTRTRKRLTHSHDLNPSYIDTRWARKAAGTVSLDSLPSYMYLGQGICVLVSHSKLTSITYYIQSLLYSLSGGMNIP